MSSKRAIRRRSCADKAKYETIELAQAAARRGKHRGQLLNAYRCQFCGKFHIGHPHGAGIRPR